MEIIDFQAYLDKLHSYFQVENRAVIEITNNSSFHRTRTEFSKETIFKAKKAAVLLPLYLDIDSIKIALIKRPSYDGVHSGQISFPGGKVEESDESLLITALRETEEEIGFSRNLINHVGALSAIYIPPSNFYVSPFIGYSNQKPLFVAEEKEVEKILEIELNDLFNPKNRKSKNMTLQGNKMLVSGYEVQDEWIWGATAIILDEFIALSKMLLNK